MQIHYRRYINSEKASDIAIAGYVGFGFVKTIQKLCVQENQRGEL